MYTYFEGRASAYEKYRPKLPDNFFRFLSDKLRLTEAEKCNRYMDIGCGTGQLTIPLSRYFNEAVGIDPAFDMVQEAKKVAKKSNCESIKWVQGYAEDISIEDYKNFNLVTIANAFHWMDQPIVISKILRLLDSQGYLVLVRSYADITSNASDWQKALNDILESWVGEERKATVGSKYEQINWVEMLNAFPFSSVLTHEIPETRIWSIEDLLGFYFTVSFCSEEKLGEYVEDYKKNVEKTLLKIHPDNKFVQKHNITLIIAKK